MRLILTVLIFFNLNLAAQVSSGVIFQAESGAPMAENEPAVFEELTEGETTFIRVVEDYPKTPEVITNRPGTENRVMEYTITFPAAGAYALYARMRIGPANADDDSFYYGNSFAEKDPDRPGDWVQVNQLAGVGFTAPSDEVTGGGSAGSGVWKWLNVTQFSGNGGFAVEEGELTQTFRLGSRENGFEWDLLGFLPAEESYTVEELEELADIVDVTPVEPIDPIASGKDKWLGNVYSSAQLPEFTSYWNQVTPENAGKWGSVEPQNNQWNFAQLDAAYELAKSNNIPFRFHVLIWGSQQPAWLIRMAPEEQLAEIRQWMDTISQRYPDIDFLEVVNEPLHAPPVQSQMHIDENRNDYGGYIEALGGEGNTGWDWVIKSFELAREFFPDTKLMINDYNIIGTAANTQAYVEIIELLQARMLIDVVGFQSHAFSTSYANENTLRSNLSTLAATGLPVIATELDIDGNTDRQQLAEYQRVFPIFWEHPSVIGITLWGWRPGLWREKASLVNPDGTERLALGWLREYVGDIVPLNSIEISGTESSIMVGETMQLEASLNPSEANNYEGIEWSVSPKNGTVGKAVIDANGLLKAVSHGTVVVTATAITNSGVAVSGQLELAIEANPNALSPELLAGLKIFPNPATDGSFVLSGTEKVKIIRIEDALGNLLKELNVSNRPTVRVNLNVAPGLYIIRFMDGESYAAKRLLVK